MKIKLIIVGIGIGLILFPAVMWFAAIFGRFSVVADVAPPKWERGFAGIALAASLRRVPVEVNPYPVTDDSLLAGLTLFRRNCAGCHGGYSRESDWGTKNFYPRVPQFGREPPTLTQAQIHYVVRHGLRYGGMAGWNGLMSDEDIWKVSAFLSRLRSLPAPVDAEWKRH